MKCCDNIGVFDIKDYTKEIDEMNILYISCKDGRPWAGPTYSIPNQIKAQTKEDNVLWYNLYKRTHREWVSSEWENWEFYCDLIDCPSGKIKDLPAPFNKPDLIIVEQFYCYANTSIIRQLLRLQIPYIIIPRGEMTNGAQKRHLLKKRICNLLIFYKFARRAAAIQYLTKQEKEDAGEKWNKEKIVIPNGVSFSDVKKANFSKDRINAVIIGRIEPYQKGLDLIIEACAGCKGKIADANMQVDIYGPDRVGRLAEMRALVEDKGLDNIIFFHDGIYGKEKERVLLNADVFIIPSRFEGHPTALIEALSYGIPALVTTGSNMRNEIENYDAGWGADTTSEDIKRAILKMINEHSSFDEKGKNARLLAKNYEWSFLARDSHEKYMRVIENNR